MLFHEKREVRPNRWNWKFLLCVHLVFVAVANGSMPNKGVSKHRSSQGISLAERFEAEQRLADLVHGSPAMAVYPASHGCIRIPMFAAKALSEITPIGTEVIVY